MVRKMEKWSGIRIQDWIIPKRYSLLESHPFLMPITFGQRPLMHVWVVTLTDRMTDRQNERSHISPSFSGVNIKSTVLYIKQHRITEKVNVIQILIALLYFVFVGSKTKQEEIYDFIAEFRQSYIRRYDDVLVERIRHIIPIFLKYLYPQQYGEASLKGEI